LLDVRLPDGDGLDLLSSLAQGGLPMPVVMMSGHGTIDDAVRATQLGAATSWRSRSGKTGCC
jgi:two-component system nitrogen regulation response regulator NtrX